MTARSLVFDLFGDYLQHRGGEVRLRGLAALAGCFGVPGPTVRVVVARLRKEGWLVARREGRETVYALGDTARRLVDERRSRVLDRTVPPWDGQWHTVLYSVPETERALREQLRTTLARLGYGPLAAAVWVSPHDRADRLRADPATAPPVRLDVLRSRSEGPGADRDIAARAWDLAGLDRDYADLVARYRPRTARYRAGELRGPDALVERVRLVQDYRPLPFRDPDLPPELLPPGWAGRRAHEVFLLAHDLLQAEAEACVDELCDGTTPSVADAG